MNTAQNTKEPVTHVNYEIQIWDKREHWNFYETFRARSHEEAKTMARKEYPVKHYIVRG